MANEISPTIELGRAVLISTALPLQLWLTTLITISPHSDSTNLQHLQQCDLLDFLLSGSSWMSRGNGLHLILELTVQGEPLDSEQREQLARSIASAPAWSQLSLRASLPINDMGELVWPNNTKQIRIDLSHSRTDNLPATPSHRMGINVHFADIRPPDGVPVIALQSVHFSMTILRTRARPPIKRQKSVKAPLPQTPPTGIEDSGLGTADVEDERGNDDVSDELLIEQSVPQRRLEDTEGDNPFIIIAGGGRISSNTDVVIAPNGPPNTPVDTGKKRKRPATASNRNRPAPEPNPHDTLREVAKLVDGAIRISVSKGMPRLAQGIKLVTNNFAGSLSEICPAIWSSHYLPALSQRAHFLSTISRSLGRAATTNARSLSLRSKTEGLADPTISVPPANLAVDSIHARLWLHVQRRLSEKPTKPLESFWSSKSLDTSEVNSDDILHESQSQNAPKELVTVTVGEPVANDILNEAQMQTDLDGSQPEEQLCGQDSLNESRDWIDSNDFEALAEHDSIDISAELSLSHSNGDEPQSRMSENTFRTGGLALEDSDSAMYAEVEDDELLLATALVAERTTRAVSLDRSQIYHEGETSSQDNSPLIYSDCEFVENDSSLNLEECELEPFRTWRDHEVTLFDDNLAPAGDGSNDEMFNWVT